MRSTWSQPSEADARDQGTNELLASAGASHSARVRAYSSPTIGEAIDAPAQLTDGEQRRIERRVVYFRAKGMPDTEAWDLAVHLVLERDRMPELGTSGSCIECENYRRNGSCLATAEVGVRPRPARAVWFCWYARRPVA